MATRTSNVPEPISDAQVSAANDALNAMVDMANVIQGKLADAGDRGLAVLDAARRKIDGKLSRALKKQTSGLTSKADQLSAATGIAVPAQPGGTAEEPVTSAALTPADAIQVCQIGTCSAATPWSTAWETPTRPCFGYFAGPDGGDQLPDMIRWAGMWQNCLTGETMNYPPVDNTGGGVGCGGGGGTGGGGGGGTGGGGGNDGGGGTGGGGGSFGPPVCPVGLPNGQPGWYHAYCDDQNRPHVFAYGIMPPILATWTDKGWFSNVTDAKASCQPCQATPPPPPPTCPPCPPSCPDITLSTTCCPEPVDFSQPGAFLFGPWADPFRAKYEAFIDCPPMQSMPTLAGVLPFVASLYPSPLTKDEPPGEP